MRVRERSTFYEPISNRRRFGEAFVILKVKADRSLNETITNRGDRNDPLCPVLLGDSANSERAEREVPLSQSLSCLMEIWCQSPRKICGRDTINARCARPRDAMT